MIFLDTNIWIELLAVKSPVKPHEVSQARRAAEFIKGNEERIVTCKNQLLEIFNAIQKIKRKEFSDRLKQEGCKGLSSVKEFRGCKEFSDAVAVCNLVMNDIRLLATVADDFTIDVDFILKNLQFADINDNMYLKYCIDNGVKLYTFDKELAEHFGARGMVVLL